MTYTQAQIDKANAVDLEKFLRAQGETLVRSGKEYRWKAHDSLTVCGNKWFRHSQSKGGLPVDFVMEFYGKSFPEAVQMLTGEPGEAQPEAGPAPSPAFRLPLRNVTNANILNYLTQERKLSPSLVNFFIAAGDIYEDAAHHNVVFVGRDADGHPHYASSRGIREKFRQDAAGAEKAFGFAHRGTGKQLLVFEAPIDLLSFIELFPKNWQQHSYLALGGVSAKALQQFLSERPDMERVFLCLDADKAGEDACNRLAGLLPDTVSVTRIQPCMKDWNDVLMRRAEVPNRNYFKSIVLKEPERGSGAPGRGPEPQLFQKHRAERAVKTGNGEDHPHERRGADPGGMALETVSSLWKAQRAARQSGRGQDLLCHAPCSRLHQRKAAAQHGAHGTLQRDLPTRRGRSGRYGQAPPDRSRGRP